MFGRKDPDAVFGPWYEYLSTLELLVLGAVGALMTATLWAGLTDPGAPLGPSVGLTAFFAGFMAFLARWSVSEERTADIVTFDEE